VCYIHPCDGQNTSTLANPRTFIDKVKTIHTGRHPTSRALSHMAACPNSPPPLAPLRFCTWQQAQEPARTAQTHAYMHEHTHIHMQADARGHRQRHAAYHLRVQHCPRLHAPPVSPSAPAPRLRLARGPGRPRQPVPVEPGEPAPGRWPRAPGRQWCRCAATARGGCFGGCGERRGDEGGGVEMRGVRG